jgi:hypothetical protein
MAAAISSRLDRARELAARTLAVATASGLDEFVVAGHLLGEAPACLTGDTAARARMLSWTVAARHGGWDELAWRGYVLVFAADLEQSNLREARHLIDDAMIYVTDRELPIPNTGIGRSARCCTCARHAGARLARTPNGSSPTSSSDRCGPSTCWASSTCAMPSRTAHGSWT